MLTVLSDMLFGSRSIPPRIPSDEIVPLPVFDDTLLFRTFVLHSMFVFDNVLDPQKLGNALELLASRNGWQKLGARVRRNNKGNLEYHVPTRVSKDRELVTKSFVSHDTTVDEDLVARHLPKPSTRPAIVGDADDFKSLYMGPDCPNKLEDYLYSDRSITGLHVVSFHDATVVVVNWLHAAFDATAKRALLDAWILMMQGRQDEITKPYSHHEDPLSELGRHVSEPHKLSDRRMSTLGMIGWGLGNISDLFRRQETRVVCLPANFVEELRAVALEELAAIEDGGNKKFLSEGDVLVAWLARLAVVNFPPDSDRTVAVQSAFSGRKALSESLLPPDKTYFSNCAFLFTTLLSVTDIRRGPLGHTAQRVRLALEEQNTREQVEAHCAILRESGPNKLPPFFGDSSMHIISVSNWSKADFFSLDFSAASVKGSNRPVRPKYIHSAQTPYRFTEMFPITGKDAHGNYWLSATRLARNWDAVEAALKRGDVLFEGPAGTGR
ncbi:hypothetical protein INS49_012282 [Diaporthe citri]|uniref:uncharacterized protein n=1 Tax=Diaporthe citri TaxID=83186 RepID=UPI001C81C71A|nr:uncharacterized protein INS49_012282 [Diaporthe citri]KAG6358763.1 hypothetical protein INS49_012282 [Diaporthe citri]